MNAEPTLVEEVERIGFATVVGVMRSAELTQLAEGLDHTSLRRSRAGVRHAMHDPGVRALAHDPRMLRIARAVVGDSAFPFSATLFDKSPEANWLVVWHQDTALPVRAKRNVEGWHSWSTKEDVLYGHASETALSSVVTLRVHLDESSTENGPLRVLPSTHRLGVLADEEIRRLAAEITAVECQAARGGILVMRPLLVHASSKSVSMNHRRVLHIEYAGSPFLPGGLELALA